MTTLLIVDDNPHMRRLVGNITADLISEIFECEDGDEVLDEFEDHHPDWVVMDIEMKRTDGLRATEDLLGRYPETKVIIMTKHNDPETRSAAFDAGAWAFCGKDDLLSLRSLILGQNRLPKSIAALNER
jgi:two-component system response regulator DegU